jgi:hypothetical protein
MGLYHTKRLIKVLKVMTLCGRYHNYKMEEGREVARISALSLQRKYFSQEPKIVSGETSGSEWKSRSKKKHGK